MHLGALILAGAAATVAVAQTTTPPAETSGAASGSASMIPTTTESPCSSLYHDFVFNTKLILPPVLNSWLAESTKRYLETQNPSTVTRHPQLWPLTEEQISKSCSASLAERTLTDLPESVATVYSSFTSEWSSFVAATAKTQAQSIASVCSSSGDATAAGIILSNVATEVPDCVSAWKLMNSDLIGTAPSSQSTSTTATSGAGATPTPSTPATGGVPKEAGAAFAAIMAVAGVVCLL